MILPAFIVAAALTASVVGSPVPNPYDVQPPSVSLRDQFNVPFSLDDARGHVLVILAAGRSGEEQSRAWGRSLAARYRSSIRLVAVADVSRVPFFFRTWVASHFQKERVRVLMDWNGDFFRSYGLSREKPGVIVIDKKGRMRHRALDTRNPVLMPDLQNKIDSMLKE